MLSLTPGSGGRQFYLFDGLGSVTDLTNLDGSLRATYQYDAWGNPRSTSGQSFNLFGFTGPERDPETGLYYFKHRFYDPATGRFLTEDPLDGKADDPPSLQRYLYAYGNPTVYWDPDGNQTQPEGRVIAVDKGADVGGGFGRSTLRVSGKIRDPDSIVRILEAEMKK